MKDEEYFSVGAKRAANQHLATSKRSAPGDVIYTPADEWHWHRAAPDHFMTHLSITETVPGDERPETDWGKHVTNDEYNNCWHPPRRSLVRQPHFVTFAAFPLVKAVYLLKS